MKTAEALFNLSEFGKPLSAQEREKLISELYTANKEVLNFFKTEPKTEFTITKEGKTRTVSASCKAEVLANPANRGWSIVSE